MSDKKWVTVRLTEQEHADCQRAAELEGMPVSAWIRRTAIRTARGQASGPTAVQPSSGLSASDLKSLITLLKKLEDS
jgi:uncharacterized protein (DUF1778 family)